MLTELTAYINAGGRGTRLNEVLPFDPNIGISKALIQVGIDSEPILGYQVRRFLALGCRNVVVACGDHEPVAEYVTKAFGNSDEVTALMTTPQSGTGGDLQLSVRTESNLFSSTTLVANVDTLLDIDERQMLMHHRLLGSEATLAVTTRTDVPNQGALLLGPESMVLLNAEAARISTEPVDISGATFRSSSCGLVLVETASMRDYEEEGDFSLYRHFLGDLTLRGTLGAFNNQDNFFMDIGVPSTYSYIRENPVIVDELFDIAVAGKQAA